MAVYFLDTSAIVKRYIAESGQAWVLSVCDPAQQHDLYISQVALVEVVATICRRAREQSISFAERERRDEWPNMSACHAGYLVEQTPS